MLTGSWTAYYVLPQVSAIYIDVIVAGPNDEYLATYGAPFIATTLPVEFEDNRTSTSLEKRVPPPDFPDQAFLLQPLDAEISVIKMISQPWMWTSAPPSAETEKQPIALDQIDSYAYINEHAGIHRIYILDSGVNARHVVSQLDLDLSYCQFLNLKGLSIPVGSKSRVDVRRQSAGFRRLGPLRLCGWKSRSSQE